jgi:hypothetical protein
MDRADEDHQDLTPRGCNITIRYQPFDSGAGGSVQEDRWAQMARNWLQTGVLPGQFSEFTPFGDSSGMQVKVGTGRAWIEGVWCESDAIEILTISASHATLPRLDLVVLRVDWDANTVGLAVLEGTPGAAVPTPTQVLNDVWELPLGLVIVAPTVTTIAASAVEPQQVWAAPDSAFVYATGAQTLATATSTALNLAGERYDDARLHYSSSANLTGTVSKTASDATLTGVGTAFLTELRVGQLISVPGGATEKRVVISIASDTSLEVDGNFANTASGQTAARLNTAIVIRTPGIYTVKGQVAFAASGTGRRIVSIREHEVAVFYQTAMPPASGATVIPVQGERDFAQWDYLELWGHQESGGNLDTVSGPTNTWLAARWTRPT